MTLLYTWYPQADGTLTRRGRDDIIVNPRIDDFVLGVTQPTTENTGAGIIRPYPTTVINTNVTVTNGNVLVDSIINGHVVLTGTGKIENCVVQGTVTQNTTSARSLIDTSGATWSTNPNVSYCTLKPQTPTPFYSGVGQRNYYAYRNQITMCTDNFTVAGDPGNNFGSNTKAEGNYLGPLIFWKPDVAYPGTPRPEGTHNDGIQFHGNRIGITDSYWYGNTIDGSTNLEFSGTCTVNGVTGVCDPSQLTRNESNGVTLSTPNGAGEVNGHFERNWFTGGHYEFNGGGGDGGTMKVVDNLFKRRFTGPPFQVNRELVLNINNYTRILTPDNHYIDNPNGAEAVAITNG